MTLQETFDGHGTHTSSAAAGNYVHIVEYFGYAKGPAKGIVPACCLGAKQTNCSISLVSTHALDSGSAAAIKSATMTTIQIYDNRHAIIEDEETCQPAMPLDFGSGHVDPNQAMDPGLIYDLDFLDYVNFICMLNYSTQQMMTLLRLQKWYCELYKGDVNYPSFVAVFSTTGVPSYPKMKTFIRELTNVGAVDVAYTSEVDVPKGLKVTVTPSSLIFSERNKKQSFRIHLEVDVEALSNGTRVAYRYRRWNDEKSQHIVTSPIVAIVR